jgi:hypothetical protein
MPADDQIASRRAVMVMFKIPRLNFKFDSDPFALTVSDAIRKSPANFSDRKT